MPSYEHTRIAEEIRALDAVPNEKENFGTWIQAGGHLAFLRRNARANELVVYANGEFTFVYAAVVPNSVLQNHSIEDLTSWDARPYDSFASYVYGGGRDDVWIERKGQPNEPRRELDQAIPLLHVRTFEGWSGPDRDYIELNPLYTHVAGIHWRRERRAYCRYNENGDLEDVVSVTMRSDAPNDLNCVTFAWRPLEEFLAAMNATLVRRFDFTLLKRGSFSGWPDGGPEMIRDSERLVYRQLVMPGHAAYTTGIQFIPLRRDNQEIFDDIRGGRRKKQYADFIAMDWRNKRVTRISTDPTATTNYFEAKHNARPYEISPAFFRPEVILKYKTDREKYTVGERDISCRTAWHLQAFDVNPAGQVFAYLCYLRNLPYAEQLHWQSFNEEPKAGLSERAITNDFEGQFVTFREPLQEVLSIVRDWHDKKATWWTLRNERLLDHVSTPLTSSRDEWGEAFLDLAKLVVEGFEIAAIRKHCDASGVTYDAKDQSIGLLERLLGHMQGAGEKHPLPALRTVQGIRTKVKSHASGEEADEMATEALSKHETFTKHFKNTCAALALELQLVASAFP